MGAVPSVISRLSRFVTLTAAVASGLVLLAGCGNQQSDPSQAGPSFPVSGQPASGVPDYVLSPSAAQIQGLGANGPLPTGLVKGKDAVREAISVHPFASKPAFVETQPVQVEETDSNFVVYVLLQSPGSANGVVFSLSADGKTLAELTFTPEMEKEGEWRRLEGDVTAFRGQKVKFRLNVDSRGNSRRDWACASGFVLE